MNVFHHSPVVNRKSIQQHGLSVIFDKTGSCGIFLTDTPSLTDNCDVWSVDASEIDMEPHHSGERPEEKWLVCYSDIPSSELTRIER